MPTAPTQQTSTRQRPSSSPSSGCHPVRKVFNCIVEDQALVAGAKSSTRNGLRQWVKQGRIRLFVPLHALERLNVLKSTPGESERTFEDIRETLSWLDEATSKHPNAVVLQGGDETFAKWADVEKYATPRSMFSEHDDQDTDGEDHGHGQAAALSAHSSASVDHDPTDLNHGALTTSSSLTDASTRLASSPARHAVPKTLRPLFNYILWRIHQEIDPVAAMESFIFLCNDAHKAACIRDFQVRCKRLEQLRDAIAREERETKNQQAPQHRSTQSTTSIGADASTDTDLLVAQPQTPPTAPAAMLKSQVNVIDPNAFDRSITLTPSSPQSNRGRHHQSQRSRGGGGSVRGKGHSTGSPKLAFTDLLYAAGQAHGGDSSIEAGPQIDPNSFERPRGGHTGRGGRRLWTPG